MQYTNAEGSKLVKTARYAIELYLTVQNFDRKIVENTIKEFNHTAGVFVTIEHYPTRTLRGCIGFIDPKEELSKAVIDAAIAAAAEDQRFVPVSHMEFEHITIEVSILDKPKLISSFSELGIKNSIKIGRDGLVLKYGYHEAIILPNVPVDNNWTKEKYLDNLCIKAGLKEHMWKTRQAKIYAITTQTFKEKEPKGEVEKVQ
ncbi:MAG: TIGR00296 family protein [Candidatus Parvarchaeum sp.]